MTPRGARHPSGDAAGETSDPELIQCLANGELGALGALYDRYQQPLRRFIARSTANGEDVDSNFVQF